MMTNNKKSARFARARATGGAKTRRGNAAHVFARKYNATREKLQDLAARAARNARWCDERAKKRKFARLARFLEAYARGGMQ